MKIQNLDIPAVKLIIPKKFGDDRGFFMETFQQNLFNNTIGQRVTFVQDNHSLSEFAGTIRGLHFQAPPRAQGKLVRCIKGSILDVAIDVRKSSPTYGVYVSAMLSAENANQLWVPEGFLHGFATLEPKTEVVYKVTDYYAPESDGNVRWNDSSLAIDWGIDTTKAIISEKDMKAPLFKDFTSPFT